MDGKQLAPERNDAQEGAVHRRKASGKPKSHGEHHNGLKSRAWPQRRESCEATQRAPWRKAGERTQELDVDANLILDLCYAIEFRMTKKSSSEAMTTAW